VLLANQDIKFPIVRVLEGTKLIGDMPPLEGMKLAESRGVDLVLFKARADPPICRLVKLEQYRLEMEKNDSLKNVAAVSSLQHQFAFDPTLKQKTIRMNGKCDESSFIRKMQQVRGFIINGHRVTVEIQRGAASGKSMEQLVERLYVELKDISKPLGIPAPPNRFLEGAMSIRFWPCSPEQAQFCNLTSVVIRNEHS